jgi:hypothetical protein
MCNLPSAAGAMFSITPPSLERWTPILSFEEVGCPKSDMQLYGAYVIKGGEEK